MAAGLLLVVLGLRAAAPGGHPPDAVIVVDGVPLGAEDVVRRAAGSAGGYEVSDDAALRAAIDQTILDELVVQRAVGLGLVHTDPVIRRRLVQALQDLAASRALAHDPDESELRDWYEAHRGALTGPERFRVDALLVPRRAELDGGAEVAALRRRLDDEPWATVVAGREDPAYRSLAGRLVDARALRASLGDSLLRAVRATPAGGIAGPIRSARGHHLLRVSERAKGEPLPYEQARATVRTRYERQAAREAFQADLEAMRAAADVWIADDAPSRLRAAAAAAR